MNLTNWSRWIAASFIEELKKRLLGGHTFIEGRDRDTSKHPNHYEVRIDGPYSKPCGTRGEFRFFIEVSILINSTRDEKNNYLHANMKGIASEALNKDFCIYKIGNVGKEDADDESLAGVMKLIPTEQIKSNEFGMIDSNTEVFQATVEAHYEMYVSNT
jgi:hypothetical protein